MVSESGSEGGLVSSVWSHESSIAIVSIVFSGEVDVMIIFSGEVDVMIIYMAARWGGTC